MEYSGTLPEVSALLFEMQIHLTRRKLVCEDEPPAAKIRKAAVRKFQDTFQQYKIVQDARVAVKTYEFQRDQLTLQRRQFALQKEDSRLLRNFLATHSRSGAYSPKPAEAEGFCEEIPDEEQVNMP